MSTYEWEKGDFKLSVAGFRKFADDFYGAYNAARAKDKLTLEALRLDMLESSKGQRGKDWDKIFDEISSKTIKTGYYGATSSKYEFATISNERARGILLVTVDPATKAQTRHAPRALRKADLAPASLKTKPALSFEDASFRLDPSTRTVSWRVQDNNHACDRAHEHPLGALFWTAMGKVEWTRGTGGVLVGNDEYNRENEDEGGGGNYVKSRIGPLGEQHLEAWERSRPSSRSPKRR
jgi:hypothetical protein